MKRRLGFGAKGEAEAVAIVQADALNAALPTLLVVPLDSAVGLHAGNPLAIAVSAREAGSHAEHVALPIQLRAIRADALSPGAVGRLKPATMSALEAALRLVLDLA